MTDNVHDLLILGAGPAGLTAGLYGRRAGLSVRILGGDTFGGRPMLHHRVENFPGFPGGVTGAELMTNWLKQVIDETGEAPTAESVNRLDLKKDPFDAFTESSVHRARSIIVATGARPRRLGVPGESEFEGKGVFYCAVCDAPLLRTMERRRAAVIGGGDTAFHTALALLPHAESVTVISKGARVKAQKTLSDKFTRDPKSGILLERRVGRIEGRENADTLILENPETGRREERFPVDAIFVGIGQQAETGFLGESLERDEDGLIITDDRLRTSTQGVFAAGDVRNTPLRQIVTAAADGALAVKSAMEYLRTGYHRSHVFTETRPETADVKR